MYLSVVLMQPQSSTDMTKNGSECMYMCECSHVYMCLSLCGDQRAASKVIPLCHGFGPWVSYYTRSHQVG